jgi:hypothetical protein
VSDGERIKILEGKIAFLIALTKVQGQKLARLENVLPSEDQGASDSLLIECRNELDRLFFNQVGTGTADLIDRLNIRIFSTMREPPQ